MLLNEGGFTHIDLFVVWPSDVQGRDWECSDEFRRRKKSRALDSISQCIPFACVGVVVSAVMVAGI